MGKRKVTKRATAKGRANVGDLATKKTKGVKGGAGSTSGFIPGAGTISAAISK